MEGARAARLAPSQLAPRPADQPAGVAQVILLGDEEYEEDPVCEVLVKEIPEINNMNQAPPHRPHEQSLRLRVPRLRPATSLPSQAQEKYNEAQMTGKALLIVVPKEHAEGYVEILIRSDPMIYAEIEEDA